jgi:hypothetical protein
LLFEGGGSMEVSGGNLALIALTIVPG